MSFLSMLDTLFLGAIKAFIEIVFNLSLLRSNNSLISNFATAIISSFIILLLLKSIHTLCEKLRNKENSFKSELLEIKKNHTGDERKKLTKELYKKNKFSPVFYFAPMLFIVIFAAFFISSLEAIGKISAYKRYTFASTTLLKQDALINFGSFSINLFPILTFALILAAVLIYSRKFDLKTKLQLLSVPVLLAVFLYTAPSGLVLYWLTISLILFLSTISYEFKKSKLFIRLGYAAASITFFIITFFKKEALILGILFILPIIFHFFENKLYRKIKFIANLEDKIKSKFIKTDKEEKKPNFKQFIVNTAVLTIFIGLFIPSTYVAASPQEYILNNLFFNPLFFILSSFLMSAGLFMLWGNAFYFLSNSKTRMLLEKVLFIYTVASLVDYMFFGLKLGIISYSLVYETGLYFSILEQVINIAVIVLICLFLSFAYKKIKSYISLVLIMVVVIFSGVSTFHVITSAMSVSDYKNNIRNESKLNFTLSTSGSNVIVIFLDRALGQYVPYILKEKPELVEKFDGFTYYQNTLSFSSCTNIAGPALLGGYEYTPVELNKRDDESLMDKNNEANLVMPRIFAKQNYEVTVSDPVYTNYQWHPDLSVFDPYEDINAFCSIGKFVDEHQTKYIYERNMSNFFIFSVMKTLPLVAQCVLYNSGNYNNVEAADEVARYHNQTTDNLSKSEGIFGAFMENYLTLTNLSTMTKITDDETNTFLFLRNDVTHEPMLLDEANGYIPSFKIDNTEYDNLNKDRFTLDDGRKLTINNYNQMAHYQTNVATLIQLGNWLDNLREKGVYDNTRIILVSDHGRGLDSIKYLPTGVESCAPLSMVKDFGETGFKTSNEFMTNADVPTLATQGLGFVAKNPYSGKEINMSEKTAHAQYISRSGEWDVNKNNGNTFLPARWMAFDSTKPNCNIYDKNYFSYLNEYVVLDSHSFN